MKYFKFLKDKVFFHKTKIGFRIVQSMHVVLQIWTLFSLYRFHLELSDFSSKTYFATFPHKKSYTFLARVDDVEWKLFFFIKRNKTMKKKLFVQKSFLQEEGFKNHFVIYSKNFRYAI